MNINVPEPITQFVCPNCNTVFKIAPRCPECGQLVRQTSTLDKKTKERAEMVKAMETIARSINDLDIFESWIMVGVADGDITSETTLKEIVEMGYTEDETMVDLMDCFLRCMKRAFKSGGLYCDLNAVSTIGKYDK